MRLIHFFLMAILLVPAAASAGTAADNFQVTLTITGACSLTANDLDFGTNSGGIAADIDAQSTLVVNCTTNAPYSIGLNNGVGTGATASVRKMTNAADGSTINYSLYEDTTKRGSQAPAWDNNCSTVPGSSAACHNATGTGADQTVNVFGRVFAGQSSVTVGTYVDTVVATVTF